MASLLLVAPRLRAAENRRRRDSLGGGLIKANGGGWWLVALYLSAVVAANLSIVYFGPSASVANAFLFIGLTFTTRDALHRAWAGSVVPRMFLLILSGGLISFALTPDAGRLALASCVAFLLSESADAITYAVLKGNRGSVRVNGSNLVGSAIDSLAFPILAFGVAFWPIIIGQFVAKFLGGLVWFFLLRKRLR